MQEANKLRSLAVGLQSSMSEECPGSPSKLMVDNDSQNGVSSSLEGSKMISYKPLQSEEGSDSSRQADELAVFAKDSEASK